MLAGLSVLCVFAIPGVQGVASAITCAVGGLVIAIFYHVVVPRFRASLSLDAFCAIYHVILYTMMVVITTQVDVDLIRVPFCLALTASGTFFRRTSYFLGVALLGVVAWRAAFALNGSVPNSVDWVLTAYLSPVIGLMIHAAMRGYAAAVKNAYERRSVELTALVSQLEREAANRERVERELQQTRSDLEQRQRLESLGLLAGGIAHDFNNLLMGILGRASLLRANPALHDSSDDLESIERAARQAGELCEHLLAFAGGQRTDPQPTDLNALLRQLERLVAGTLPGNVVVDLQLSDDLPAVRIDRPQVQKVLLNMIVNASDAMQPGGGRVMIRTRASHCEATYFVGAHPPQEREPGEYVLLEVADTGHGMDAETLSRVFEPFFSTKASGRGLGLSLALGTLRAHDGAIRVSSEQGLGARFELIFPARREVTAVTLPTRIDPIGDTRRGPSRVLVIDDEPFVREFIEQALAGWGHDVICAEGAVSGLQALCHPREPLDLVILDMVMPDGHGLEMLREARRRGVTTPVIFTSGFSRPTRGEAEPEGVVGFLQKPYGMAELADALDAALEPPLDLQSAAAGGP